MTARAHVDDIQVAHRIHGGGHPVLLIAGLGAVKELWTDEFVEQLASDFKVITVDNRGIGETPAGEKSFSISQFAEDTTGLLRSIGEWPAHLVGYSMGGYIAQEMALANPEMVDRLVLLGTECGGAGGVRQEPGILLQMTDGGDGERHFLLSADWLKENVAGLGDIFGASDGRDVERFARQADAIRAWNGTCARLPEMDKPTLVITGSDDIVILPENARVLSELIPDAQLVEFEGGHHGLLLQFPRELARIIANFLSGG
jgi:pimeloyl-ACP methyl ester carboxylesterase